MRNRRLLAGTMASMVVFSLVFGSMGANAEEAEIGVGEGEVVTIWECNWGGENYESTLQKLAEEATNANIDGKGYKVEVTMVPWDNYYETFLTATIAGTAPDIACEASTGPILFAQMGETLDLTPILEQWEEEGSPMLEQIPQAAFNFFNYKGEQIGMPFGVDGRGITYRKDIFEKAGITELPTTWDEFEEVCAKLKEYGVDPLVFSGNQAATLAGASNLFLASNGTTHYNADNEPLVLSEANQETYEFIKRLVDNGYIPEGTLGYSPSDAERIFLDGQAAMILCSAPTFIPEDYLDIMAALPPFQGPSADQIYTGAGYQGYHCYDQSGHPEATLAVMKWWIENNDILWTEGDNLVIPVRAEQRDAVIESDMMKDWVDNWVGHPNARSTSAWNMELPDYVSALESTQYGAVLEAILGGEDIKEASERNYEEIKEIIDEFLEE